MENMSLSIISKEHNKRFRTKVVLQGISRRLHINTRDGEKDADMEDDCAGGSCKI